MKINLKLVSLVAVALTTGLAACSNTTPESNNQVAPNATPASDITPGGTPATSTTPGGAMKETPGGAMNKGGAMKDTKGDAMKKTNP